MSSELIKVITIVVVSAIFITAFRIRLQEYGLLLTVATICTVLILLVGNLFGEIAKLRDLLGQNTSTGIYFETALKALGIAYITTFAADACRDFGLSSLAQVTETAGKITIFTLSIPLMNAVLEAALKFVGI